MSAAPMSFCVARQSTRLAGSTGGGAANTEQREQATFLLTALFLSPDSIAFSSLSLSLSPQVGRNSWRRRLVCALNTDATKKGGSSLIESPGFSCAKLTLWRAKAATTAAAAHCVFLSIFGRPNYACTPNANTRGPFEFQFHLQVCEILPPSMRRN